MHRQAGRLVDDEHQPVPVEEACEHLFRCHGHCPSLPKRLSRSRHERQHPSKLVNRLSGGLKRTSASLGEAIADLSKTGLDAATLEELEAELIRADLGPETAGRIVVALGESRFKIGLNPDEVKAALAGEIEKVLSPVAKPLEVTAKPFIILVVGVNGTGKTTTIGKLAAKFRAEGKSGDYGRRRHVSRRRNRSTENLGRTHRRGA